LCGPTESSSGTQATPTRTKDLGRWWIEDDRWFWQWNSWAYAEVVGFHTVVDGDQVRWFSWQIRR
jgi:hypothetical protein